MAMEKVRANLVLIFVGTVVVMESSLVLVWKMDVDMVKLNLGCGSKRLVGYTNADMMGGDVTVDLRERWLWPDASADEILMDHVLEHLPLEHVYREAARVLKPGGTWRIYVPHSNSPFAHRYGHIQYFSLWTFKDIADPPAYGLPKAFETVSLRLGFGRIVRWAGWMSPLANLCPLGWEFLGLPTAEIIWTGRRTEQHSASTGRRRGGEE